jgi:hypothetical protein
VKRGSPMMVVIVVRTLLLGVSLALCGTSRGEGVVWGQEHSILEVPCETLPPMTESQRRILHIVRWPLLLGMLAGFFIWLGLVASGGCAPGAPDLSTKELVKAELKNMYPSAGGTPLTLSIDLTNATQRDRLVAAYRSMQSWGQEVGRPPAPDLYLTLTLTKGRRMVILLSRENYPYVLLRTYEGDQLKDSIYLQPNAMREYMIDLAS